MIAFVLAAPLALASLALGQQFQGFFPLVEPSSEKPWVIGETNTLSWEVGFDAYKDQLPPSFDVILHDPFGTAMPIRIVQRVPLEAKTIGVKLGEGVPTGDNYRLSFGDTWQGGVFATSGKFSIVAAGEATVGQIPAGKPTVTVEEAGNPDQHFLATLNGAHLPTATTEDGKIVTGAARPRSVFTGKVAVLALAGVLGASFLGGLRVIL